MNNILWMGLVALAFGVGAMLAYYSAEHDLGRGNAL